MEPDYGVMLRQQGFGDIPQYLYGVELFDLSATDVGLYTSFQSRRFDGDWYAVSLDFGLEQIAAVVNKSSPENAHALAGFLQTARPGQSIQFDDPIVVDIEARLGEMQRAQSGEQFIPLVVKRIL